MPVKKNLIVRVDPQSLGAQCSRCPLRNSVPVLGDGPKEFKVAYVGEAPGREEVKNGRPFVGRSGEQAEEYLRKVKSPRSEVWIDNAICCFPPGGDLGSYIKQEKKRCKSEGREFHHPIDCCRPRLLTALHTPRCSRCSKWNSGPAEVVCACKHPCWVTNGPEPVVVMAAGNSALMSLVGVEGILKWRGSPLDMGRRRRLAVGQESPPYMGGKP